MESRSINFTHQQFNEHVFKAQKNIFKKVEQALVRVTDEDLQDIYDGLDKFYQGKLSTEIPPEEIKMNEKKRDRAYSQFLQYLIWYSYDQVNSEKKKDYASNLAQDLLQKSLFFEFEPWIEPETGSTVLHSLCRYGDFENVETLLKNGKFKQVISHPDDNGDTPLALVCRRDDENHRKTFNLLRDSGAKTHDPKTISPLPFIPSDWLRQSSEEHKPAKNDREKSPHHHHAKTKLHNHRLIERKMRRDESQLMPLH